MTVDELNQRLEQLALGEVEMLSREEFEQAFRALPSLPDKKKAAITLGDWRRCGVIFVGTERVFVSFTRRPTRPQPPSFIRDVRPSA
ncbi:MAG TPA: hypothetical protein VGU45_02830 [Microvirga sp.]|jgi:hypothetical protein|nr:hypothetical protein [Microvirga sp.]